MLRLVSCLCQLNPSLLFTFTFTFPFSLYSTHCLMGKISRWFRSLLSPSPPETPHPHSHTKRRWTFVKSYRENHHHGTLNSNNRAIAVATAAAAVAEVAVASAQTASSALNDGGRLTAGGCSASHVSSFCVRHNREESAAVKIQSSFRAYLSRRALKALKALVKVQALVRGNLVRRKQTVNIQRRIQALLRAQARASADRRSQSISISISSPLLHPDPATPEKFDYAAALLANSTKNNDHLLMLKRNSSKSNKTPKRLSVQQGHSCSTRTGSTDDERSDKILEIDTGKPQFTHKQKNLFQSPHYTSLFPSLAFHQTLSSPSYEAQPFNPLDMNPHIRGPFTPTKSDGSINGSNGYYDRPNYLTCTESSRAKMRSMSAPKQRMGLQFEGSGSMVNKYSMYGELKGSCGSNTKNREKVYGLNADRYFASKAYPGSGRLDKLGMPINGDGYFSGGGGSNWNRY